jgi:hypothetical protein
MLFGHSSNQGSQYRSRNQKVIEGFTTSFSNDATREEQNRDQRFTQTTDEVSRQVSEVARAQQVANMETNNFLNVTTANTQYLNKNVRLNDGTIGYVTKQGVFKQYNSQTDANETMGKNGCPTEVLPLDTGDSILTKNGKYLNGDVPLYVGSPMIKGQQCGYAGQNIYVGSSVQGSGNTKYLGCKNGKKNESLIATGLKVPTENPQCPVGTFQCAKIKGYCYDPKRDSMVSTYMIPRYDAPIGKSIKGKSSPFLSDDGVTYLWFRQSGFDGQCGTKPTMPPCPVGTAPCHSRPGYCYDPSRKIMVQTASPNASSTETEKPLYMSLVLGKLFNYDNPISQYTAAKPQTLPSTSFQSWIPDSQFTNKDFAPQNKIYLQFKKAAAALMPHLNIGESSSLTVNTRGNKIQWKMQGIDTTAISAYAYINGSWIFNKDINLSNLRDELDNLLPKLYIQFNYDTLYLRTPSITGNMDYSYYFKSPVESIFQGSRNGGVRYSSEGAIFTVKKTSNTTAEATLKYGPNTMNVLYTFEQRIPKFQAHLLAQDGNTKLWKVRDGYDNTCGSEPQVPPLIKGDEIMKKCRDIANSGGFGVYGIMNNECYVGNSVDGLQNGSNCNSFGSGLMAGSGDDFAAYELEGVKNSGLYRYGFVTADETLREYPSNLQRATDEFYSIGKKQIARTPRVKSFTGLGGGMNKCQKKCVSEFGDNCEAYNYENTNGNCTIYGSSSLSEGVVIPTGNAELMIRKKELDNNTSCPKSFTTVKSSVWSALPKDGMMNSSKMCNLGEITKTSQKNQHQEINLTRQSIQNMNNHVNSDIRSNEQLHSVYNNGLNTLQQNLQAYDQLYNNA